MQKARAAGAEGARVVGYRAMLNECVDTGNRVVDEVSTVLVTWEECRGSHT